MEGILPNAGAEILGNGTDLSLYVCKAVPFDLIQAGIDLAKEMIDSGKATAQLEKFVELSNQE